jgi:hypothetical protein
MIRQFRGLGGSMHTTSRHSTKRARVAARTLAIIASAALVVGTTAATASAQATFTFNVTNGNDAGPGSFRQAITDASNPLVGGPVDIVFDPGLHVNLTSGEVFYENVQDVSLIGNGSTLDGNNVDRIFRVRDQSVPVALSVDSLAFVNGELTSPVGGNGVPS